MARHAYLIMLHAQLEQAALLLRLLDDPRNDFYIHIDRKSGPVDDAPLRAAVHAGRVFPAPRMRVDWGADSQVFCELMLLRMAFANGPYQYYHLLSGADLPLRSQEEIHAFFDAHAGREFVNFEAETLNEDRLSRVRYWHLFRGSRNVALRALSRALLEGQKLLRVDRLRRCPLTVQKGANWFSITENFARYILEREGDWLRLLRRTRFPDELLVQTALINSPYWENRYSQEYGSAVGNLRAIDWTRGTPYVWRMGDLEELMSSGCLFARKFSMEADSEIVHAVAARVLGNEDKNGR